MKLTKKVVDALPAPTAGQAFHRDSDLKGFGVRVTASGRKAFVVERKINGRSRRTTIGTYPEITVEQARKRAQEIISEMILERRDPVLAKEDKAIELITLDHVYRDYIEEKRLKPNSIRGYEGTMRLAFDDWRERPIKAINREMVAQRFRQLSLTSPSRANHHMRVLVAMFHFAMDRYSYSDGRRVITENPGSVLSSSKSWHRPIRRKSYIKSHQLPAWWRAVQELGGVIPNPNDLAARDYLLLVLFTGLRRVEAATLEWRNIDFEQGTLFVPETKNHEPHLLPMSDFVRELLSQRQHNGSTYVFPSRGASGHLENVDYQVRAIRKASGVDFMIHDLRRTFITIAESLDISAYALKRLLNHKGSSVTEGYIIADVERLRSPMEKIASAILRIAGAS